MKIRRKDFRQSSEFCSDWYHLGWGRKKQKTKKKRNHYNTGYCVSV